MYSLCTRTFRLSPFFSLLLGSTRQPPVPREMGSESNCSGEGNYSSVGCSLFAQAEQLGVDRENREWTIPNIHLHFGALGKLNGNAVFTRIAFLLWLTL